MTAATDWVRRNVNPNMTEEQERCALVLCAIAAPYNLHLAGKNLPDSGWHWRDGCLTVRLKSELATFDADGLTRLVMRAHEQRCRVAIRPCSQFSITIQINARQVDGDRMFERHPGVEALTR